MTKRDAYTQGLRDATASAIRAIRGRQRIYRAKEIEAMNAERSASTNRAANFHGERWAMFNCTRESHDYAISAVLMAHKEATK